MPVDHRRKEREMCWESWYQDLIDASCVRYPLPLQAGFPRTLGIFYSPGDTDLRASMPLHILPSNQRAISYVYLTSFHLHVASIYRFICGIWSYEL